MLDCLVKLKGCFRDDAFLLLFLYQCSSSKLFSYSVLVHSGGVHGGHYYAFIRPTLSDQW
jgi:hypothetical protein